MPRKRWLVLGVLLAAVPVLAAWGFRQLVPSGLRLGSIQPFYLASRDLGTFTSPEGSTSVQIIVNDAGAMHSGNHWVWILHSTRFMGQRVIAEGYVDFLETNREAFPLRWISENEIELTFRAGRHAGTKVRHTCAVPP